MKRPGGLVLLILFVIGSLACAAATPAAGSGAATASRNSNIISTAEIDAGTFQNAYDVVQRLRPTWLTRDRTSSSQSLGGASVGLLAYLDGTRLGGIETLRDLSPTGISSLEFMDAATATAVLRGIGSSVITGAIVAHSRVGR